MSEWVLSKLTGDAQPGDFLEGILKSYKAHDVVTWQEQQERPPASLILAKDTEDVLTVCERLSTSDISSCPVFDAGDNCIGIIDFSDVVAYLLKMDCQTHGSLKNGNTVWEELGTVPISSAVDLSKRNPKVIVQGNAFLLEVLRVFEKDKPRRVLVADEQGKVVAVLAPSAIVRFLMIRMKGKYDNIMPKTVTDLGIGSTPVTSVKKNQSLLEAMHLMHQTRHSVLAVVDPTNGELSGSISMSDIKFVFQERRFPMLMSSCWKYICEMRERSDNEVFPYFGVQNADQLHMVISKLLATNVHHLYVVNGQQQPIKVVSFTDICGGLARWVK